MLVGWVRYRGSNRLFGRLGVAGKGGGLQRYVSRSGHSD